MQFGKLKCFDYVIFISLLTASITGIAGQSPCIDGAKFPDSSNKAKYYICIGGNWKEAICQSGQIFNPITALCEASVINPTNCGVYTNGQIIPDEANCVNFYACALGVLIKRSCPAGEYFNKAKLQCVKDDGSCSTVVPTPPPVVTPPGSGNFGNVSNGQCWVDPADCQSFFICCNGDVFKQSCHNCGSLPAGGKVPIAGSDKDFIQCINGSLVKVTCPNNLVFDPTLLICRNPCSVYVPLPHSGTYYAGSPSSDSGYYKCTVGTSGNTPGPLQKCPNGAQFIQALGSLFGTDQFCINLTQLNRICQSQVYAAFPLVANPYCGSSRLTPYYVLCNNGVTNIQRCAVGSIVDESGYCKNANVDCEANSTLPQFPGCICG